LQVGAGDVAAEDAVGERSFGLGERRLRIDHFERESFAGGVAQAGESQTFAAVSALVRREATWSEATRASW